MAKTASISLRIEPAVKAQLEALYASFGISVTDAINIFLHTSLMEGGFPFQPKQPRYNAETEAAVKAALPCLPEGSYPVYKDHLRW